MGSRAYHEPAETEDPRNAILDMIEANIRQAVSFDPALEAPLRARLSRLLPKPQPAAPSGDVWEASVVLTALAECRRKIKSPASVKLIDTAHGFAKARFETLKSSKDPAA